MEANLKELNPENENNELYYIIKNENENKDKAFLGQKVNAEKTVEENKNDEENKFVFILDNRKRVTVEKYRGEKKVDIREFYESKGVMRPCKRGINLNVDNWNKLKEYMKEIDEAITKIE